ncbi:gamma-glutamylcyclotransferase [Erythrobacter sp. HL-111]|uniref:gamma-glutamylcyclotransferase family protein n=1 Tax=Erythrobacter sp. HL-111 TaxID=1798193 RepID=UPI0006DA0822|nr:gamma-glutamylcyclotransferase family protein [Erythrobacter sp. HL-111]KPP94142.1 MAG: hypothetical protein HLUCCO15_05320 [Erythrobacteraceae bacterium HL-111]SDS64596.1 Uncharacterized conserved protein YtfP, gamma-glutamylcyclotransferase (GGCT)/AIG2-like family [Erythrobacter sp. HL-111]
MRLFFYGVLREGVGDWPFLAGLGLGSQASVQGALFAIPDPAGWYPALVLTRAGHATNVVGSLHDAGEVDLAVLDAFEGPQYERMAVRVDGWAAGGSEAQAYVWTGDLPAGAQAIAHGDFAAWLAETRRSAYAGA